MNPSKNNYALKLLEQQPLGLEDTFVYRCKVCGKCCKNREDIILMPYDVFRLAKFLGRTPKEIADRYCELYEGPSSHMPLLWLRPILPDNACPFQRGKKCSVHAAKPCVCRVFPLARVYGPTGGAKFYLNQGCSNEGAYPITVRDWIGDVASEESAQVGRVWTDALLRIAYSIAPDRFSCSASDRAELLKAIAIMLYYQYDIKESFLPQLERNVAFLIKQLKEQHSIMVPTVQEFLAFTQKALAYEGGGELKTMKRKSLCNCPKCKSTCLWHKPDGTVLCTVCMYLMDTDGNIVGNLRVNKPEVPRP